MTRAGIARPVELLVATVPPELNNLLFYREDVRTQDLIVPIWFESATVSPSAAGMFLDINRSVRMNS